MGKLLWLASYPKSGNTWLRAFLHNYIKQPAAPHSINRLTDLCAVECDAAFFRKYAPRPTSELSTAEVQALRPKVHQDLARLDEGVVFVKTHNANLALHGTAFCTPSLTAGAIYLVRDPRDVAVSYAAYTGLGLDETIAFMAQKGAANRATEAQVFELLSGWSAHVTSWSHDQRFLTLRYEDLLAAPEAGFGKIVRYLGDGPDPPRLRNAIAFSGFEKLTEQERQDGYAGHAPGAAAPFFRIGKSAQWRQALTAAQAARIEAAHAAVMHRFGYL